MNSNSALGKKMLNKMIQQINQFKQLMHLEVVAKKPKLVNEKKKMLQINNFTKSCNIQSSQQKHRRPSTARSSQSSLEKQLNSYKIKQETALLNPFTKIHIRRPSSAMCRLVEPSHSSKSRQKQNSRYQQIKQYYQNKYVHNQQKECCSDCQCECHQKVNFDALEKNQRIGTVRRLQYFRRRL